MFENQHVQKILKIAVWLVALLAVYIFVLALNALKANRYIGSGIATANTITVSGEGKVSAKPDIAQFSFTVLEERATVEEAQTAAAEKSNAAVKFLKDSGVAERDIRTLGFNVNPRYEYGPIAPMPLPATASGAAADSAVGVSYPYPGTDGSRTQAGVEVSQTIEVKVRDTARAGELLAGITALGIQNVGGISFTIDDEEGLERAARQEAIADAQKKAKQLADDLDVRLVRVVSFSESGPIYPYYAAALKVAETSADAVIPEIPVGENEITSQVNITYEIR